jgi:hypothetical protein
VVVIWPINYINPKNPVEITGTNQFVAGLENKLNKDYKMYWQVNGGQLNPMSDSKTSNYKQADVSVTNWNWSLTNEYKITFVARDLSDKEVSSNSVMVRVGAKPWWMWW